MKVTGSSSTGPLAGARPAQRSAGGGGFSPTASEEAQASAPTARAGAVSALSSLDALLALQETLSPLERRKRAVRRAGAILDVLDEVKLALLDGESGGDAALQRLDAAVRDLREQTDDPGLEAVLEQVEIRAAVELAKRERAPRI